MDGWQIASLVGNVVMVLASVWAWSVISDELAAWWARGAERVRRFEAREDARRQS